MEGERERERESESEREREQVSHGVSKDFKVTKKYCTMPRYSILYYSIQ